MASNHSDPEISLTALEKAGEDDVVEDTRQLPGERFGKYTLVGELGLGGMAEVFLAVQYGLEGFLKVVTLKRVLPHLTQSPDFVQMFVDEARLAARLEHPNIVRTYEFGEEDGQYYTVMEYLAGEDLGSMMNRAAISRQPVPFHMAANVVAQLCCGLHFAHELTDTAGRPLGLVHRDINPSNVIITYGGEVKIIDFGVAKATTNQTHTLSGTIKGKVAYMSPEQVLARGIDRRSDVFSLGVVLWELVAGRPLFARDTDAATLYALMNDPIPRAGRYRAHVPEELETVTATALARTPADRYDTAEDMQAALEAFLATQADLVARESAHAGATARKSAHAGATARDLARTIESLFGSTRAEAKRSIAQTRSLSKKASLVMKLRSEVRAGLEQREPAQIAMGETPSRKLGVILAALLVLGMLAGFGALLLRDDEAKQPVAAPVAQSSLEIASTPPGAAILVGGEPTGLTTPATLTGLAPGEVVISVELPGHLSATRTFNVQAGARTQHSFELAPATGRFVAAGLPAGAVIYVDGQEYQAGEVITVSAGRHTVHVELAGKSLVQETIETTSGHQVWELHDDRLVRK